MKRSQRQWRTDRQYGVRQVSQQVSIASRPRSQNGSDPRCISQPEDQESQTHEKPALSDRNGADEDSVHVRLRATREALFKRYCFRRTALWDHLKSYRSKLEQHYRGQDPGLEGWRPDWTEEEFDLSHLSTAMKLSKALRVAQNNIDVAVTVCGEEGIEPMDWQDLDFPRDRTEGYRESEERDAIDNAPHGAIWEWLDVMPDNMTEQPLEFLDYESWDKDWDGDVQPFDSWSCADVDIVAEMKSAKRIKKLHPGGPPKWTWNAEVKGRLEENSSRVLPSHFS